MNNEFNFTNGEVIGKQIKKQTNIRTYYLLFFEVGNKRLVPLLVLHVPIVGADRIPLDDHTTRLFIT